MAGLAGGVNAQLLPITTCTICGLAALSREARCKTFDASADGYGRGEAFAGPPLVPRARPCLPRRPADGPGLVCSRIYSSWMHAAVSSLPAALRWHIGVQAMDRLPH